MNEDKANARAQEARGGSPFLNTDQAAAYLKISTRLLKQLRRAGTGPIYRHHSYLIQYHIDDLDAWSMEHSNRGQRS